jgi:hypothetical protein
MESLRRCSQLGLAVWIAAWLLTLPLRLRHTSLPGLLERRTAMTKGQLRSSPQEIEPIVRVVVWVSQWRLFRLPLFPRACLRQALALYTVLSRLGYPVTIHFGVHKAGDALQGHSWITVHGRPVAESLPAGIFQQVYTYASVPTCGPRADCGAGGRESQHTEGASDGYHAHAAHTP